MSADQHPLLAAAQAVAKKNSAHRGRGSILATLARWQADAAEEAVQARLDEFFPAVFLPDGTVVPLHEYADAATR